MLFFSLAVGSNCSQPLVLDSAIKRATTWLPILPWSRLYIYIYICMYVCIYLYTLHVGKNHLTERVPMCQSILIFLAATSRAEPWDFMRLQWCSPCINAMAVRWAKHSTLLAARRPNSLTPIARCFFEECRNEQLKHQPDLIICFIFTFKTNLSRCLQGMFSSRMLFMAEAGQIQGMNHWDVLNLDLGQTEPSSGASSQTFRLHRTWSARVCISQDSQVWGSLDVLIDFVSADRLLIASPVPWLLDLPRGVSGSSRTSSVWRYIRQVLRRCAREFARKMSEYMSGFGCMSQVLSVESSPWRPANLAMLRYGFLQKMGYRFKRWF